MHTYFFGLGNTSVPLVFKNNLFGLWMSLFIYWILYSGGRMALEKLFLCSFLFLHALCLFLLHHLSWDWYIPLTLPLALPTIFSSFVSTPWLPLVWGLKSFFCCSSSKNIPSLEVEFEFSGGEEVDPSHLTTRNMNWITKRKKKTF